MTAKQRLQLEQSEKRQKLNELLAIAPDQLTEEQPGRNGHAHHPDAAN